MSSVFFHVDMDAFYASVEQLDNPEYRDQPVIVGARPGQRGVVSACSYEARRFGIHSAMPISQAYRLCPHGIYLPVRMNRYHELSNRIMKLLDAYTPSVVQISVDEAFLDLTGTDRLLGPPEIVAREIKERVRREIGLTISVGVAPSRFLAKLASDVDKPDGLHVVSKGAEADFVASLPLAALWGIGKKMQASLAAHGIHTVVQLREYTREELEDAFGRAASHYLHAISRGQDPGIYGKNRSHSISGERTFTTDVRDGEIVCDALLEIASNCIFRIREENGHSRTANLKLRLSDFSTFTQSRTVNHEIATEDELYRIVLKLFYDKWDGNSAIRLVGCGLSNITAGASAHQGDLFSDKSEKARKVQSAVHALSRQGITVQKARLLKRKKDGL